MDDLISRKDAIAAFRNEYIDTEAGTNAKSVGINVGLTIAIHIAEDLPSVTPISKETNKISKDFVDCEDATIQILSELRAEYSCFDEKEEPVYRALSEAIKTLRLVNNSQELDKNFGESEDAIGRQAAIDALQKLTFKHYMECGEYIGEDTKIVQLINSENAINAIINLPSVTPQSAQVSVSQRECCHYYLESGDTLYQSADWDGGIGFDYIRDIRYCPICGRRLQ